ncbi:MAG: SUMF1/EgtB/PvdO family nonheme iron enzyme [Candidatus Cloacimonetes bacterium]|nr:SUMF1/EgtB/PvdO family nonheme iron enzyme [Candidatus Cloacimonadota bacterium]
MELTAGMKLGIFTIIRQIGAGGMSEVYLVRDNLDRLFALKTMSSKRSYDPSFRQRFEQEARIMASLSHPNIVQLHSYFEEEGRFCLVMEYVEGGSLRELSRKIGPIPEKRALNILKQIAEALSYAHSKGIIHRDVKPSNILLDANDNVKVMDFGIARMTESPGLTKTGSQMGTLVYMSPEQIRDSKHVDEKSDIYSLGVTLYEMLTGMPPFDEKNSSDFDIRVNIVQNELPDPRDIYPHIGEESLHLFIGLTKKDKEERLSLSELLTDMLPEKQKLTESPEKTIENEGYNEEENLPLKKKGILTKAILLIAFLAILIFVSWNLGNKEEQNKEEEIVEASEEEQVLEKYEQEPKIALEMVFVEGGNFQMGSNSLPLSEKPIHKVTISSFWIGKYELTQKEWKEVMNNNPSNRKNDNLPVINVTWYDAVEFCNKLSINEGFTPCYSGSGSSITCDWNANGYRLPTEAEWEYAARGGLKSRGYEFSGSNNIDAVAWYAENSGDQTHEVGSKKPNELGIYDMSGNGWEWCWDWHEGFYYEISPTHHPKGPNTGTFRSLRGGGHGLCDSDCRVSSRLFNYPDGKYNGALRVVRAHF